MSKINGNPDIQNWVGNLEPICTVSVSLMGLFHLGW